MLRPLCRTIAPLTLLGLFANTANAQPVIPGFAACPYGSEVSNGFSLSFAPDGRLFIGHEDNGILVRIFRMAAGGAPAQLYGDTDMPDPDTCAFDARGLVSGTPGSVIVGGAGCGAVPSDGCLWVVRPNQTTSILFGPSPLIGNVLHTRFDSTGRLVFTSGVTGNVMTTSGAFPTTLFTVLGAARSIAIDAADRIYTSNTLTGIISLHSSAGAVIDASFATGFNGSIAVGPGTAPWGSDVYGIETSTSGNRLIRFSVPDGTPTVIGTGFFGTDLAFGPDGALYINTRPDQTSNSPILRIAPCPANWDSIGCVDSGDFFAYLDDFFAGIGDFDGSGGTNSTDFFAFLDAFFDGC